MGNDLGMVKNLSSDWNPKFRSREKSELPILV